MRNSGKIEKLMNYAKDIYDKELSLKELYEAAIPNDEEKEDFINKWEFMSLTQGNRPQFALKGTKLTEEEENEDQYL